MVDFKKLLEKEKETAVNMQEAQAGGGYDYVPATEGKHPARFVEYVELGKHPEFFEGKEKSQPAEYVRLGFELLGPTDIQEIEVEGNKKKIAKYLSFEVAVKFTEKAKFLKLMKMMAAGRNQITHMAEMLGEAFLLDIKHGKSADGKRTYENIWWDSAWHVAPPRIIKQGDPLTGEADTSIDISNRIPANLRAVRIFLWNNPTKECWDSLFIDGTREVKAADGTTTQESKNWLQEKILSAKNFGGSALQQLTAGMTRDLPTGTTSDGTSGTQNSAKKTNVGTTSSIPAEQSSSASAELDNESALAALGL